MSKEVRTLIFAWLLKIQPGERSAFMASCSNWVSICRNPPSRDGFGEFREL